MALGRFFFSCRRRHTRCGRDWSSDVCSSDLDDWIVAITEPVVGLTRESVPSSALATHTASPPYAIPAGPLPTRSEERRVGKEGRSRWGRSSTRSKAWHPDATGCGGSWRPCSGGDLEAAGAQWLSVVFFFHAEDGIRDADVTGVQTCALPISTTGSSRSPSQSSG